MTITAKSKATSPDLTFGKMGMFDASTGEQSVWKNGKLFAVIEKHCYDAGMTSVVYKVDYYTVEFWTDELAESEPTNFCAIAHGSARAALTAARNFVRTSAAESTQPTGA